MNNLHSRDKLELRSPESIRYIQESKTFTVIKGSLVVESKDNQRQRYVKGDTFTAQRGVLQYLLPEGKTTLGIKNFEPLN